MKRKRYVITVHDDEVPYLSDNEYRDKIFKIKSMADPISIKRGEFYALYFEFPKDPEEESVLAKIASFYPGLIEEVVKKLRESGEYGKVEVNCQEFEQEELDRTLDSIKRHSEETAH